MQNTFFSVRTMLTRCVSIFIHKLSYYTALKSRKTFLKVTQMAYKHATSRRKLPKPSHLVVKRRDVTQRFSCNVNTITWLQNRYNAFGAVVDLPIYYSPLVTTRRTDVNTEVTLLWNWFQPASGTARRTLGYHGYVKTYLIRTSTVTNNVNLF